MSKRTIVLHSCASKKPSTSAAFSPAAKVVLTAIRGYQVLVRPSLIGSCRFVPTCSHYAAEAVARHGAFRGALLSLRRLARCHPLGGSGLDPVP